MTARITRDDIIAAAIAKGIDTVGAEQLAETTESMRDLRVQSAATEENRDVTLIGEEFLDEDSRTKNRRIEITGEILKEGELPRYEYKVITNDGKPDTIGTTGDLLAETLQNRYRKVSH